MKNLKLFVTALVLMFAVDVVWIGFIASDLYKSQIGFLLAPEVNWPAAVLFYIFYIATLIVFVLTPALKERSLRSAIVLGGLFGFAAYMTYDLTNLATTRDWPVLLTVIDIVWGSVLTAIVSGATYWIGVKFLKL